METGFPDKKAFTEYLKGYMKKVVKYLEENNKAGEVDGFKANIQKVSTSRSTTLCLGLLFGDLGYYIEDLIKLLCVETSGRPAYHEL